MIGIDAGGGRMNDDMTKTRTHPHLLLKGTRTAMSFVAEARALARAHPYPETGQPDYSRMADVLSRAVLFADWQVVGAAALVRAGEVTRIAEMALSPGFRDDEFARRLTWRMLADAAHELTETPEIEDAYGKPLKIDRFVARRRANRAEDKAMRPTPIGRIRIDAAAGPQTRRDLPPAGARIPRAPKATVL